MAINQKHSTSAEEKASTLHSHGSIRVNGVRVSRHVFSERVSVITGQQWEWEREAPEYKFPKGMIADGTGCGSTKSRYAVA